MSIRDPLAPPKEFLRELARADDRHNDHRREGRTATTSPSRPPASSSVAPIAVAVAGVPPKSVQALLNTLITLHLRGGTQLHGVLAQVWQYEFVVRCGDGTFRIILKHAVDMLEPVRPEAVPA